MTQSELAEKCDTIKQTIYKYESGKVENIPLERVVLLANALHTTPAYLRGLDAIANEQDAELIRIALERIGAKEEAELFCDPKQVMSDVERLNSFAEADEERKLLSMFRELNAEGQIKALDLIDDMVKSEKYIKNNPAGLVEKKA